MFKSGFSYGGGLTTTLQFYVHEGIHYGDTPGLSDISKRKQAASEIKKALTKTGTYKLIFIIVLDSGRIRSDDLATMKVVLESIEDSSVPYAIVVNKAQERVVKDFNDEGIKKMLLTMLNENLPNKTDQIFCHPEIDELKNKDDFVVKANPHFKEFLKGLKSKIILPKNVKPIRTEDFDQLKEFFESEIEAMRANFLKQKEEYDRQNTVFKEQIEIFQQERKEQTKELQTERAEREKQIKTLQKEREEQAKVFEKEREKQERVLQREREERKEQDRILQKEREERKEQERALLREREERQKQERALQREREERKEQERALQRE